MATQSESMVRPPLASHSIGLGLFGLPLGALLAFVGAFVRGPFQSPTFVPDQVRYGTTVGSAHWPLGVFIIFLGYVAILIGTISLGTMLQHTGERSDAKAGVWLACAGLVLHLAALAGLVLVFPPLGQSLAGGNAAALEHMRAFYTSTPFVFASAAGSALYVLGAMLLSIPIWRSVRLPRYAAPLYLLHAPLLSLAATEILGFEQLGAFFLVVSSALLVHAGRHEHIYPPGNEFERRELTA